MSGQQPVIAVVLPVYNTAPFLEEAVRSVICQTFRDWELILVDDCSTDGTPEIATRLALEDPRIRVIRNKVNQREARSRNIGFDHISPSVRYVANMDSDDRCHPDRFQKEFEFLETHPDCTLCGSSIALMDETGAIFAERVYPCGTRRIRKLYCRYNAFAHPTIMFRRNILDAGFRYDPGHRCVDYDLFFRILKQHEADNLPEILLDYRISSTQQKSVYLRETLYDSIVIQCPHLFHPRFFSPMNIFCWLAEIVLCAMPGSLIYFLFCRKYFRKSSNSKTNSEE